jgi:hypothetical protein
MFAKGPVVYYTLVSGAAFAGAQRGRPSDQREQLDHPFVKEGRFASLLIRGLELAESLSDGFHTLWRKAMRSLRETRKSLG